MGISREGGSCRVAHCPAYRRWRGVAWTRTGVGIGSLSLVFEVIVSQIRTQDRTEDGRADPDRTRDWTGDGPRPRPVAVPSDAETGEAEQLNRLQRTAYTTALQAFPALSCVTRTVGLQ